MSLNINMIKDKILDAVFAAGEYVLSAHDIEKNIEVKAGDDNFATAYDVETQRRLISALGEIVPEASFLAEEAGMDGSTPQGVFFVIDPIDGTTNFIHGLMHSAISVALCDGEVTLFGCVLNPYLGECFYASLGEGAYIRKNGTDKRLSVSERKLSDALVGFGTTPYEKKYAEATFDTVCKFFRICRDVRRGGSAALDVCYVAAGRYDAYFEFMLSPWDFAAGALILSEAGGILTDLNGDPIVGVKKTPVLATNVASHKEAVEVLK